MGKAARKNIVKGLRKTDRKAVKKLSKGQRKLVQGALKGGAGGSWVTKLVRDASGPKGPSREEQMRLKQARNSSGPAQTAAFFLTKNPDAKTLLVGEGNFSFARSLIELLGEGRGSNVTATAFDTRKEMKSKYEDAAANVAQVKASGAQVLYGIDGTRLEVHSELSKPYDLIVFNFPHVGLGIKDQELNVAANQELVAKFLESGSLLCSDKGLICVTTKKGDPYDSWRVPLLGMRVSTLRLKNTVAFDPASFPGYAHRRTAGAHGEDEGGSDNDIMSHGAHTFIFTPEEVQKSKKDSGDSIKKKKGKLLFTAGKRGGFNPKGGSSKGAKK
uniref:25S rRNA (uridine-N(3))-methyltransferase BMT5-like domain-containing protein n=1 Tax=Hemiselmis andersenii TaxID=464988 RepID=A0A6U4NC07_HEMAN|mmetsp:Transcript_35059/g.82149  ORF Transcript_35059/g.82149 Transcript_35059/m.82149 type:complete len:330 (-) Transcript_35059:90-1079(-)